MEDFNETDVCSLLTHTLRNHPSQWFGTLPHNFVHSFKQFSDLIKSGFRHFDPEVLDKKLLKQWKVSHESPMEFSECFRLFMFEAPKSQMKFQYLMDRFEYFLIKSSNPKKKFKLKPHSEYFSDGVAQSQTDTVDVKQLHTAE